MSTLHTQPGIGGISSLLKEKYEHKIWRQDQCIVLTQACHVPSLWCEPGREELHGTCYSDPANIQH